MIEFLATGPLTIPTTRAVAGRGTEKTNIQELLSDTSDDFHGIGVYIFGIRASRGLTPWYVGKATVNFAQECFTQPNLNKYNFVLRRTERGAPILLLLQHPTQPGATNKKATAAAERSLIAMCAESNPDLLNKHHNHSPNWSIRGVLSTGKGKPSEAAVCLRKMFLL